MSDGIKNPNAFELGDVLKDLKRHVWDSSAETPNKEFVERVRKMSANEIMGASVDAGVHNPDGTLTPEYGGGHPLARKARKIRNRKGK